VVGEAALDETGAVVGETGTVVGEAALDETGAMVGEAALALAMAAVASAAGVGEDPLG